MKNVYEKPEIVVESFSSEDIITASGGLVTNKFTAGAENTIEF